MALSAGKLAALLLLALLHCAPVHGASTLRNYQVHGGGSQDAYLSPSSDMIKALKYIESLQQRADNSEKPTGDYDEEDKIRLLVQLASRGDEDAQRREDAASWFDEKTPEWVRVLIKMLEPSQASEWRLHKSRRPAPDTEPPASNVVRPHKKYPLMFEDEENVRDSKRATEDLDEQYTPQSLANMRSIFEELGKLSNAQNQKREDAHNDDDDDDDDDDGDTNEGEEEENGAYRTRSPLYEDVAGGDEWFPLEEQVETEEMVKGSREEYERALGESSEESDLIERRASPEDDTKRLDYYLLMEMTDQAQKRDLMEAQNARRKLLNRPSLLDPRAIKQLLSALSTKLQIPPEDLVGMLFMEETRKQQRLPDAQPARKAGAPRYRSRVIKYYNGRQPEVTLGDIPADVKTADILKVLGLGNLANKNVNYVLKPRPYKTPAARYFAARRGGLSGAELGRAPSKRKDDYDDAVDEDEVATFLAAKLLTEYPDTGSTDRKRAPDSIFPYEAYEEAMKEYFDQAETGKGAPAKRDTHGMEEAEVQQKTPTEVAIPEQSDQQIPESVTEGEGEGEKEHHTKLMAGM